MKPIKRKKFIFVLTHDFGVKFIREGRGSHALYQSPTGKAVIPHYEELSGDLALKILKELDINQAEFKKRILA